jgi:hypothetical protein
VVKATIAVSIRGSRTENKRTNLAVSSQGRQF